MSNISDVKWKPVFLSDIFTKITRGKISDLRNIADGKTIIIAASGVNEGLSCFAAEHPIALNAMTISFNGVGTGTAFVHNYPFNLNSDCGLVETKKPLSVNALRFIAVSINKNKFNYGYKANESRILRQTILLPVNCYGEPDYVFMENYIKNLEKKKRGEYIEYYTTICKDIPRGGGNNSI